MNKKCFAILMLALFCMVKLVSAQENHIITEIDVKGNVYTNTKKIKKAIKSKIGEEYVQSSIDKDIKSIFEIGSFDDVMVDVTDYNKGIRVTFIVVDKPRIKRIDFKGNKEFTDNTLMDKLDLKIKELFDKKKALDSVEKITNLYKEKGFSDVIVESLPSFENEGTEVVLTFFITEGSKIKIGKINLIGGAAFNKNKVLDLIKLDVGKVFKPEELDEEIKKIEKFYKDKGFINFKMGETIIAYNKDKTQAFITISIYEGKSYKAGKVEIIGNSSLGAAELKQCLMLKTGDTLSEQSLNISLALMQDKYAEKGYIKISIVPDYKINDEDNTADISFRIVEGDIIYINRIYIEGNTTTKEYVIRRELLIKDGDVFNIKRIRRSQEKIYNLGFFKDIRMDYNETQEPNKVDLILSVEEQMSGMVSVGMGYSPEYGMMGNAQLQWNNLFGKGQKLNLIFDLGVGRISTSTASGIYGLGGRTKNFQFSFAEPWLFGKQLLAGLDIYSNYRYRDAWSEQRTGASAKLGPHLSENTNLLFTYTLEKVKIPWARYEVEKDTNGIMNSNLAAYFIKDTRDNIFDASRGARTSVSIEKSGGLLGGDNDLLKSNISYGKFFPLFWKFILGTQLRWGGISSPAGKTTPIYERFFVGGGETVRGYEYGYRKPEVGVVDGGKLMFVGNVELKLPIAKQGMNTMLEGVLFLDVGGTWNDIEDIRFTTGTRRDELKAGIGFGFRFTPMPMFPIRLDWGLGLNKTDYDNFKARKLQIYLTIGPTF